MGHIVTHIKSYIVIGSMYLFDTNSKQTNTESFYRQLPILIPIIFS